MTFYHRKKIVMLALILPFFMGCVKTEDKKNSIFDLLNRSFDITTIQALWPSNSIDRVWQQNSIQYYPTNAIYTQSAVRVYLPREGKHYTCERIGESGVELYAPKAYFRLKQSLISNSNTITTIEIFKEDVNLFETLSKFIYLKPMTLGEAKVIFPSQIWSSKAYGHMKNTIFLNNEVQSEIMVDGRMVEVRIRYEWDDPVSVVLNESRKMLEGRDKKEEFFALPIKMLDLSIFRKPVGWVFCSQERLLGCPTNLDSIRKKISNVTYDHMIDMGIVPLRHDQRNFFRSTLPPIRSGIYGSTNNFVKVFTSVRVNGREEVTSVYIDLRKLPTANTVILPDQIQIPVNIQDCRDKFTCFYECFRHDGLYTFIACDKVAFMFRNDKPVSVLYYGTQPTGDEFCQVREQTYQTN